MKNLFKNMKQKFNTTVETVKEKAVEFLATAQTIITSSKLALSNNRGENYIDSGVKVLIAVVLGALLLGGLYTLFDTVILPRLTLEINNMFNYKP